MIFSLLNLTYEDFWILPFTPGPPFILFLCLDSDVSTVSCCLVLGICIPLNGNAIFFNQLKTDVIMLVFFNKRLLLISILKVEYESNMVFICVKNSFSRFQ